MTTRDDLAEVETAAADRARAEARNCLRGCRGALVDDQYIEALGRIQLIIEGALEELRRLVRLARATQCREDAEWCDDQADFKGDLYNGIPGDTYRHTAAVFRARAAELEKPPETEAGA